MNIQQIEQQIMAEYPNLLKFDGYNHSHTLTLQEFIDRFRDINREFSTYTNNPVVNSLQCPSRKNRSLGDIFLITKYYFPNVSLMDVRKALFNSRILRSMYCCGINKIVYVDNIESYSSYLQQNPGYMNWQYDEWGIPNKAEITDDDIQEKKPVVDKKVISAAQSASVTFS